jgi:small subunit ribosomal protein S3
VPRDDPHARPGVIIGKKGADIETLRKKLANMTDSELHLNIVEVRKPELDAQLVAEASPSSWSAACRSAVP